MNHNFKPSSKATRALLAAGSLLVSILILGSTASLASLYNAESQAVSVPAVAVAQL